MQGMASKLFKTAVTATIALVSLADVQAGSIVGEIKFTDAPPKRSPIKVSRIKSCSTRPHRSPSYAD